jgi:hypothetical protein
MLPSRIAFVLVSTLLSTAPLAAQNPWAVVPAFPTVCYTEGDPFPEQIEAAGVANQDALGRQVPKKGPRRIQEVHAVHGPGPSSGPDRQQ